MTATDVGAIGSQEVLCSSPCQCDKTKLIYKRRVLYDKSTSSLPDNYVDKTFLNGLKKNVNLRKYKLNDALSNACVVTQELSSVCWCVIAFVYLDNKWTSQATLFTTSNFLVTLLYVLFEAEWSFYRWYQDVKMAIIFLSFTLGLSPVLKTLTHTISTDSIYFMTVMLMFIHLVTNDYGLVSDIVKPALSLTAAIAGSIALASRLSTTFYVFEFLVLAVELFILFPILRRRIQVTWPEFRLPITLFMGLVAFLLIWTVSPGYAILSLMAQMFLNIVCPVMFIRWQKYKENINGPWDEATIPD